MEGHAGKCVERYCELGRNSVSALQLAENTAHWMIINLHLKVFESTGEWTGNTCCSDRLHMLVRGQSLETCSKLDGQNAGTNSHQVQKRL